MNSSDSGYTSTLATNFINTPPRVDCYNCGVVCANTVPVHDGLMEPELYCSVCDAGPLDETDDE